MKVGFIGLGTMGGSMAYNALQGGHELVVHDIRRASETRHLEAGASALHARQQVEVGDTAARDAVRLERCDHHDAAEQAKQRERQHPPPHVLKVGLVYGRI